MNDLEPPDASTALPPGPSFVADACTVEGWSAWATATLYKALAAAHLRPTSGPDWRVRFGAPVGEDFSAAGPGRRLGALPGLALLLQPPQLARLLGALPAPQRARIGWPETWVLPADAAAWAAVRAAEGVPAWWWLVASSRPEPRRLVCLGANEAPPRSLRPQLALRAAPAGEAGPTAWLQGGHRLLVRRFALVRGLDPLRVSLHREGLSLRADVAWVGAPAAGLPGSDGAGASGRAGPWSALRARLPRAGTAAEATMAAAAAALFTAARDALWVEALDAGADPEALFALVALDFAVDGAGEAQLLAAHVDPVEVARAAAGDGRRVLRAVLADTVRVVVASLDAADLGVCAAAERAARGGFVAVWPPPSVSGTSASSATAGSPDAVDAPDQDGTRSAASGLGPAPRPRPDSEPMGLRWPRARDRQWSAAWGHAALPDRPWLGTPGELLPLGAARVVRAGGTLHVLDSGQARIWQALAAGARPAELAARLGAPDLDDLLTAWAATGLLGPGRASAPTDPLPPPGHLRGVAWAQAFFAGDLPEGLPATLGDVPVPPLPPRVVVCKAVTGPSRLVPIEPDQALMWLQACGAAPFDDGPGAVALVAALAAAECWALEVGGDSAPRLAAHCAGQPPPTAEERAG